MSEISAIGAPETCPESALPLPLPLPTPIELPTVSSLDARISQLSRILSTPSGTDKLLLTLCYTTLLTSSILRRLSTHTLHQQARLLLAKVVSPPSTIILVKPAPPSGLLVLSQRLKAASALISDFRIFARLWGLVAIYKWGRSVLDAPPPDLFLRQVAYSQVAVNVFYQALENGAYLSSKGVMGWSTEKQGKAWLWSSRFWMAHVVLDLARLGYEYSTFDESKEKGGEGENLKVEEAKRKWWREAVISLAYAPLTVHWSLEKGLLGETGVGILGSIAGVVGFRELWRLAGMQ